MLLNECCGSYASLVCHSSELILWRKDQAWCIRYLHA